MDRLVSSVRHNLVVVDKLQQSVKELQQRRRDLNEAIAKNYSYLEELTQKTLSIKKKVEEALSKLCAPRIIRVLE